MYKDVERLIQTLHEHPQNEPRPELNSTIKQRLSRRMRLRRRLQSVYHFGSFSFVGVVVVLYVFWVVASANQTYPQFIAFTTDRSPFVDDQVGDGLFHYEDGSYPTMARAAGGIDPLETESNEWEEWILVEAEDEMPRTSVHIGEPHPDTEEDHVVQAHIVQAGVDFLFEAFHLDVSWIRYYEQRDHAEYSSFLDDADVETEDVEQVQETEVDSIQVERVVFFIRPPNGQIGGNDLWQVELALQRDMTSQEGPGWNVYKYRWNTDLDHVLQELEEAMMSDLYEQGDN